MARLKYFNTQTGNWENISTNGKDGASVHIGDSEPFDDSTAIKYKRYTVEYSPSDLTLRDDIIYAFVASDEKKTEVLALLSELSTLTSINMTVHVTVPGMGEIMRFPVLFEVKNEAVGTNGVIQALTLEYFTNNPDDGIITQTGGFSIYKDGLFFAPIDYVQPIAELGVVFDIDVLYL